MGSSESKRKLVVEDVNGEAGVQVTEAVVRRIKGLPDLPQKRDKSNNNSSQKTQEKADSRNTSPRGERKFKEMSKDIEDFYNEKLKDLQKRSEDLQQHSNEQFAAAVKETEQKFLKYTSSPVCQDLQTKVLECYQTKADNILDCSPIVHAFSTCVDRARMSVSHSHSYSQAPAQAQPVS